MMKIVSNKEKLIRANGKGTESILKIMESGVKSVLPSEIMPRKLKNEKDHLRIGKDKISWPGRGNVYLLGAGKASASMAREAYEIFGDRIRKGLVITKDEESTGKIGPIDVEKGGHPVPTRSGFQAAKKLKKMAGEIKKEDLAICLLSGGGSSLMSLPVKEISLNEMIETNEALIKSGANIKEINSVRKHLSRIKGGKLARAIAPGKTASLIISDVVGDDPATIASGPTAGDPTTFRDALNILEKYDLEAKVPESARDHLKRNLETPSRETVKPEEFSSLKSSNWILAGNLTALEAMKEEADRLGTKPLILSSMIEGRSREVGKILGGLGKSMVSEGKPLSPPAVVLSGGETTVNLTEEGRGGPNQELVLAAAKKIKGFSRLTVASIDTDGEDGNSKYAGGVVDEESLENEELEEINRNLKNHQSSNFLEKINGAVYSEPTGTNVNDIRAVLAL